MLAGLLLLGALVGAQFFLSRRTRRTLNLPLLAATVVLIVFLVNALEHRFRRTKRPQGCQGSNAFDSDRCALRCPRPRL